METIYPNTFCEFSDLIQADVLNRFSLKRYKGHAIIDWLNFTKGEISADKAHISKINRTIRNKYRNKLIFIVIRESIKKDSENSFMKTIKKLTKIKDSVVCAIRKIGWSFVSKNSDDQTVVLLDRALRHFDRRTIIVSGDQYRDIGNIYNSSPFEVTFYKQSYPAATRELLICGIDLHKVHGTNNNTLCAKDTCKYHKSTNNYVPRHNYPPPHINVHYIEDNNYSDYGGSPSSVSSYSSESSSNIMYDAAHPVYVTYDPADNFAAEDYDTGYYPAAAQNPAYYSAHHIRACNCPVL